MILYMHDYMQMRELRFVCFTSTLWDMAKWETINYLFIQSSEHIVTHELAKGSPPGTIKQIFEPFNKIWSAFVSFLPAGVICISVTSSNTMFTYSSNPRRVPTISRSLFIITHIRLPIHLSMRARGCKRAVAMVTMVWKEVCKVVNLWFGCDSRCFALKRTGRGEEIWATVGVCNELAVSRFSVSDAYVHPYPYFQRLPLLLCWWLHCRLLC